MRQSRAGETTVGRFAAMLALVAVVNLGASEMALAADHRISAQSERFDCSSVKPGDTITLASGSRGPLSIRDCNGTSTNRIIVRNDPRGTSPTVMRRSSGSGEGFLFSCNSCIGVVIDGSYKWQGAPAGKTYGIKVTVTGGAGPSAFIRIGGLSRFLTIRSVEIDGAWPAISRVGSGIRVNDHAVTRSKYPGLWREGILIENNYLHNIAAEGMYVGPNYALGDIPLRNIEIRHNRVEDIGYEAINTKSMWAGDNRIHHNLIRRVGKNGSDSDKTSQYSGIKNISGTVKIYNNWVEATGQHGIRVWTEDGPKISEGKGPFEAHIWNNVIFNAGSLWRSFMAKSFGIGIGAADCCEKPIPFVYSNTIVNPRQAAIGMNGNVGEGYVRDNIIAGAGSNPVIIVPSIIKLINNRVGSVTQMAFADADRLKFRLTVNSPARNEGSSNFPPTDIDDVTRPKDGAPDQGAYEGNNF